MVLLLNTTDDFHYQCYEKLIRQPTANGTATEYCIIKRHNALTWMTAQKACQSLNYRLAVINDLDERMFM